MSNPSPSGSQEVDFAPSLGRIAVHNDLITQDQLDECLAVQVVMRERGFDMPLGQILIEKFYLDQPSIRAMLRAQRTADDEAETRQRIDRMVKFTAAEHDCLVERIGALKLVDLADLDSSIEIQQALAELGIDKMLGEVLIERGLIGKTVIRDILDRHATTTGLLRFGKGLERRERTLAEEAAQEVSSTTGDFPGGETGWDALFFGAIARDLGCVDERQIAEILVCQARLKELGIIKRIGQLLIEREWLTLPDVRRILDQQKHRQGRIDWIGLQRIEKERPAAPDMRFARLLLENDLLSPQQIQECLYVAREVRALGFASKSLAQVIIDKQYLDRHVVARLMDAMAQDAGDSGRPLDRSVLDRAARDILESRRMDLRVLEGDAFSCERPRSSSGTALASGFSQNSVLIVLAVLGVGLLLWLLFS